MKVYVNQKVVNGPWGGGNSFVRAFRRHIHEKHELVDVHDGLGAHDVPDVNVIVGAFEPNVEQMLMHKMTFGSTVPLVIRVNECDARKDTKNVDKHLIELSKHVDGTVFVSQWLHDHLMNKGWVCKKNTVIRNGVDADIFKPGAKFNNGKVNIAAHHWSDNEKKGRDIYEALDAFVGDHKDTFSFTYIGRHRCNFKNTNVIQPMWGKALGEELGKYDVYVSASRFEPGPNHVIESISCGLPTFVHKDGGGAVEFTGGTGVYSDWNELSAMLIEKKMPVANFSFDTWKQCAEKYVEFLQSL